jgi:hypothetical protein
MTLEDRIEELRCKLKTLQISVEQKRDLGHMLYLVNGMKGVLAEVERTILKELATNGKGH